MAVAYCDTTADLVQVFREIESYKGLKTVLTTDWEDEGNPAVYKLDKSGFVEMVLDDGVMMTDAGVNTAGNALSGGEFSYQTATDTLFVYLSDETDPDLSVMEIGLDWGNIKTTARNDAQEILEGLLSPVYAVPFQKIVDTAKSYNTKAYDYWIRRATALLTCYIIIGQVNPDDPAAAALYRQVDNPEPLEVGEKPGIVQRILNGDITIRTQRNAREAGGFNVFEGSSNGTTAYFEVTGRYTYNQAERWKVVIDTLGAPGTATYKFQKERGGTFTDIQTLQATRKSGGDDQRINIDSGIYVRFVGTFAVDDEITIECFPGGDMPPVHRTGQLRLSRG